MSDSVSKQVLTQIVTLEAEMEMKKAQVLSSKPLATHPKPRVRRRTQKTAEDEILEGADGDTEGATLLGQAEDPVAADPTTSADMGLFDEDPSEDEVDNGTQKRAVGQPVKSTFKERLNNGHEDQKSPGSTTGCSQVTGKGNLVATKAALPGLVKNWASAVVPSTCTSARPEPSHTTSSHVPLSVSSKGLLTKTRTTSKSSLTLPQTPANSVTDLSRPPIGGLGEGDSADDIYEGPVGIGAKADVRGKSMRKNLLLIADEDDELTLPLSQSMEESQHTTWRRLKRKASNTISLSSTEELKPDDGPFTGIDSDVKLVDEV
ncbi:hypothetical protein BDN67DRAFT_986315 [Paxillus ammoniavirescens]|nr:hypothetical protein BDN67DRAFT_986315 [Paxillus ammoniavirescens]